MNLYLLKSRRGGGFKAFYVVVRSSSKPSHVSPSHRSAKSQLLKPLDIALLLQDVSLRPYPSVTSLSLYRSFLASFEESDYGFRLVKYDRPLFFFFFKFHFSQSFLLWSALLNAKFSIPVKNKMSPQSGNQKF